MSRSEWTDPGFRSSTSDLDPSASPIEQRARRASPDGWNEDLGPYGPTPWELPGIGESGARCGEWFVAAVCNEHGHADMGTHSCGRRSCPRCWGRWAQEAGIRAATRLQAFRYTQPDNWRRQMAHAVVAPPEGEIRTARDYWDGKSRAAELAKSKGWRGFAVIAHPFRPTDEAKERYRAEVPRDEEGEPQYGIWVWLRNDVEGFEHLIYWSPHYHIIGATGAGMEPATDGDEWNYTFIRSTTRFEGIRDRESHNDMYGLVRYLLSHTGWPSESTNQAVTWYGELANSVFVEEASEEWQNQKPSEGVLSALEREITEVAGGVVDDESGDGRGESDDLGECPVDGCDGLLIDVFDVEHYLRWADPEPPPEARKRMRAARDWRLGEVHPPPGLKHPRSEEDAHEAFEAIVDGY